MSLLQYYERFKGISDTEDYVDIKIGIGKGIKDFDTQSSATYTEAEIYCGISFLMGGDMYYHWKLLEELHNDNLMGKDGYPKSLYKAYTLMSDWNHYTHRYGGSGRCGGGLAHRSCIQWIVDYDKEKKWKVF